MKKRCLALCVYVSSFAASTALGHTHDETNEVIGAAITRAAFYYDDLPWGSPPDNDPPPTTWRGFLGADTNGWMPQTTARRLTILTSFTRELQLGNVKNSITPTPSTP